MAPPTMARESAADGAWRHFVGAFVTTLDVVSEQAVERETSLLPSYAACLPRDLTLVTREGFSGLDPLLRERRVLTDDELGRYWSTTESQAKSGVVLDDVLQAWHIALDILRGWARCTVAEDELPVDLMLDFLEWTIPWMQRGSRVTIEFYQRHGPVAPADAERARRSFVRHALAGTIPAGELARRCGVFGLDPAGKFYALQAHAGDEASRRHRQAWLVADRALRQHGHFARVEEHVWGFVPELPTEVPEIPIGIGGPATFEGLPQAFSLVSRALRTATSLDLTGCHSVRSLGLDPAILEDNEVGDGLIERYVTPVEMLGGSGADILTTVRTYLTHQTIPSGPRRSSSSTRTPCATACGDSRRSPARPSVTPNRSRPCGGRWSDTVC